MIHKDSRELLLHRFGNKPGKLLSHLTKETFTSIAISKMKKQDETKITEAKEISELFENYYTSLYSPQTLDDDKALAFLEESKIPKLTQAQIDQLNEPITKETIER